MPDQPLCRTGYLNLPYADSLLPLHRHQVEPTYPTPGFTRMPTQQEKQAKPTNNQGQACKATANQSKSSNKPAVGSTTGSRGSQNRDARNLHNSKSRPVRTRLDLCLVLQGRSGQARRLARKVLNWLMQSGRLPQYRLLVAVKAEPGPRELANNHFSFLYL